MANHETHVFREERLPFILHRDFRPHADYHGSNWHDSIEILSIRAGQGYVLCDGQETLLSAGDTFVVNSGELHAFRAQDGACDFCYDCLIVGTEFCRQNGLELSNMSFSSCLHDAAVGEAMAAVRTAWEGQESLRIPRVRIAVLALLCYLAENHLDHTGVRAAQSPELLVKGAIRYIEAHFAEAISLCDVAQELCVSRYHLAHLFRRSTGHSVVSYIKLLRCRRAKELLLQREHSIAEIAQACGFSTVPYFTRCFSQIYGYPPGQARKRNGAHAK